ncbi:hypothetical protein JOQ06_029031 [Pogonophryne albipinna]|uniref:Uncharacterized protein n=1 Tax=Pogonophryne albipinna TaxID=1090488 RepID=A0AAD6BA34_9TELE|nr:hypothetical protein JOQ06_029031 [Pogonophryne albipinna]
MMKGWLRNGGRDEKNVSSVLESPNSSDKSGTFRISKNIPTTKDVEPLLEIDGDIRSFEVFLSSRTPVLAAKDVEMFLPCTVNLDPKLREIIAAESWKAQLTKLYNQTSSLLS